MVRSAPPKPTFLHLRCHIWPQIWWAPAVSLLAHPDRSGSGKVGRGPGFGCNTLLHNCAASASSASFMQQRSGASSPNGCLAKPTAGLVAGAGPAGGRQQHQRHFQCRHSSCRTSITALGQQSGKTGTCTGKTQQRDQGKGCPPQGGALPAGINARPQGCHRNVDHVRIEFCSYKLDCRRSTLLGPLAMVVPHRPQTGCGPTTTLDALDWVWESRPAAATPHHYRLHLRHP